MSKRRNKPARTQLKNLPLQVLGIGLSEEETKAVAADLDKNIGKTSCCQRAAMKLGLLMLAHNITALGTILDIQDCANHLIKREDDGNLSVKRELMDIMRKRGHVQ